MHRRRAGLALVEVLLPLPYAACPPYLVFYPILSSPLFHLALAVVLPDPVLFYILQCRALCRALCRAIYAVLYTVPYSAIPYYILPYSLCMYYMPLLVPRSLCSA